MNYELQALALKADFILPIKAGCILLVVISLALAKVTLIGLLHSGC